MLQLLRWPDPWNYGFHNTFYQRAARGGAAVEVGANIGATTVFTADFFTRVYAFEPCSRNLAYLRRNIEVNSLMNVEVMPLALGDVPGSAYLYLDPTNHSGQDTLAPPPTGKTALTEVVTISTLDEALPMVSDATFLHIDTGGYDIKVLQGAQQFLRRQMQKPYIQLTFAPRNMVRCGSSVSELLTFVDDSHYQMMYLANHNPAPMTRHILAELFDAWKDTGAWIVLYLLPQDSQ